MKFDKPACTTEEHCTILKQRGLVVEDPESLRISLDQIGYYRLTGYMYPFQFREGNHLFKENVTFQIIENHYRFDKRFRLLLIEVIEQIEIAIRAKICNTMCLKYGAHWYLMKDLFINNDFHDNFITEIEKHCNESSEVFIKKYLNTYSDPALPPAWMMMETITFRKMAVLYKNLKDTEEKKLIANSYALAVNIFESWLQSLNFVRNCCAHHLRLWNRRLPIKPVIPRRKNNRFLKEVTEATDQQMYGILSCILFLLKTINPNSDFKLRLKKLFEDHPSVNIAYMGFVGEWKSEDIWL